MNKLSRFALVLLASSFAVAAREPAPTAPVAPAQVMYDCNDNGVEDSVDIAIGSSSDADHDGIPDECQSQLPK